MNYTEFKQTVTNKNMRLVMDMCHWVKTNSTLIDTGYSCMYFYIQPQTDANEVIISLLCEQERFSNMYVYDEYEMDGQIRKMYNESFKKLARYNPTRSLIMIIVRMPVL